MVRPARIKAAETRFASRAGCALWKLQVPGLRINLRHSSRFHRDRGTQWVRRGLHAAMLVGGITTTSPLYQPQHLHCIFIGDPACPTRRVPGMSWMLTKIINGL